MIKVFKKFGILFVIAVLFLPGCGKTPEYVGTYKKGGMYIELKANGKFVANNYVKLTGKYKVNGIEVEFNVQTLNDKDFSRKVMGSLKDNKLTGPDNIEYTKSEE